MIYAIYSQAEAIIIPWCGIISYTSKTVKIRQLCVEDRNEISLPIELGLFTVASENVDWKLFDEIQDLAFQVKTYNVMIHKSKLNWIQQYVDFYEQPWEVLQNMIKPEDFDGTFDFGSKSNQQERINRLDDLRVTNSYITLGVDPNDDINKIKKVWQALAMIYHPDRETGNIEHFRMLRESYERIIKDREI